MDMVDHQAMKFFFQLFFGVSVVFILFMVSFAINFYIRAIDLVRQVSSIAKEENGDWKFYNSLTQINRFTFFPDTLLEQSDTQKMRDAKLRLIQHSKNNRRRLILALIGYGVFWFVFLVWIVFLVFNHQSL